MKTREIYITCVQCGAQVICKTKPPKYCKECKKIIAKERLKIYFKTKKGLENRKKTLIKFSISEKGLKQKEYIKEYMQSEAYKMAKKKYSQSEKGKEVRRNARIKYFKTEKGKDLSLKYYYKKVYAPELIEIKMLERKILRYCRDAN